MSGNVFFFVVLLTACALCTGCSSSTPPEPQPPAQKPDAGGPENVSHPKPPTTEELDAAMETLRPLHRKMGPVQPGDWLASHPERGQTFEEYLRIDPVKPCLVRNTIYVQPVGHFTGPQRRVITLASEFIGLYFNLPVKIKKDLPLSVIPAGARRFHPSWRDENGERIPQILTGYVLDEVLKPSLPDDAAAFIAFTGSDLWPGEGWNFVFGQATLRERVGVWSIYRFGRPGAGEEEFRQTLLRTMKTGTHETGHMFSMYHCTAYECNMCGSNNMAESDRRPLWLCPECLAKVCWACEIAPAARYEKLAGFCRKHGLKTEREFYEKSVRKLPGGNE